jgi:hypothetical protein
MMSKPGHLVAQPGDIFLLLVPSNNEKQRLRQRQADLQARYGGEPVAFPHITCQRFTPPEGQFPEACIASLKGELKAQPQFTIFTDKLIQFHAPYWGTQVLRWRVQESEEYAGFRELLDAALSKLKCSSHFKRQRHATCTALDLEDVVDLESNPAEGAFPAPLFIAREMLVSKLVDGNQFQILDNIYLPDP